MSHDVILVGGGLANGLIAYRLRTDFPKLRILLLEQGPTLGGNHTWSFHKTDVTPGQLAWLEPFAAHAWPHYDIRFPQLTRRLQGGYYSITSEQLHRVVVAALGTGVKLNARVARISNQWVELEEGNPIEASLVVDGRGMTNSGTLDVRYQKFLGQVWQLTSNHGLDGPILMDATIAQRDGFRFMYSLPLAADRVLIEDTYYSDTPALATDEMREAIRTYANQQNWQATEMLREETGVLPVVLGGDIRAFWSNDPGIPRSGVRAGLFHYTTSYSLPLAARLADSIAQAWPVTSEALYEYVRGQSFALWRRGRFFRLLNRMLYLAAEPEERYRVLQHFYRLPDEVIQRFYAGQTTVADMGRILSGRPPVPVTRALGSLLRGAGRGATSLD